MTPTRIAGLVCLIVGLIGVAYPFSNVQTWAAGYCVLAVLGIIKS